MANFGLCVLPNGLIWEYISSSENDFLYDEIFCRRAYLRHGIVISDGDIIVDAGANIGIFAIFSSTVASQLTVLCIEPIPTVVNVLRRNLSQCAKSYPTNSFSVVCAAIADIESESEQFVYFESNPGESTRHIEEQAAQHHTLMAAAEESEYSEICELYHDGAIIMHKKRLSEFIRKFILQNPHQLRRHSLAEYAPWKNLAKNLI